MKTIKGFEDEEIEVSDFGEWVGNDYVDYKFEYKNNQKIMKELFRENQELKKQLSNNRQIKKQKEFINFLERMLDSDGDKFSVVRVCDVLSKYKKIIGGKSEDIN